jgi:hypothetical protein
VIVRVRKLNRGNIVCLWLMDDEAFSHLQNLNLEKILLLFSHRLLRMAKDDSSRYVLFLFSLILSSLLTKQIFSYHPS